MLEVSDVEGRKAPNEPCVLGMDKPEDTGHLGGSLAGVVGSNCVHCWRVLVKSCSLLVSITAFF